MSDIALSTNAQAPSRPFSNKQFFGGKAVGLICGAPVGWGLAAMALTGTGLPIVGVGLTMLAGGLALGLVVKKYHPHGGYYRGFALGALLGFNFGAAIPAGMSAYASIRAHLG